MPRRYSGFFNQELGGHSTVLFASCGISIARGAIEEGPGVRIRLPPPESRLRTRLPPSGSPETQPIQAGHARLRAERAALVAFDSLTKESLGGRHIAPGAQPEVDRPARPINGTIQVAPLASDLDVCLVDPP